MQNLHPRGVDIPIYHFKVHKTIVISYYRVILSLKCIQRNGVGSLFCVSPQQYLSKGLLSDPIKDHMKTLHPRKVDIPTYHFVVIKNLGISSLRDTFRAHHNPIHGVVPFN